MFFLFTAHFVNATSFNAIKPDTLLFEIVDGDTLPLLVYDPVYIVSPTAEMSKKQIKQFNRLVYNVKKVYPYAIIAKEKLWEINNHLLTLNNEQEKKLFLDSAENALMQRFEKELKKLSISQGKILVRLIDRETNRTTYSLVKELRSTWTAMFWQSLGRLFGYNLKVEYDPSNNAEDREIESIIQKIHWGFL